MQVDFGGNMDNETMQCPFCNETINVNAKKCKYCGEWLVEKEPNFIMSLYSKTKFNSEKKILAIILNILFIIMSTVFTIVFFVNTDSIFWILLAILCLNWVAITLFIIDRTNSTSK